MTLITEGLIKKKTKRFDGNFLGVKKFIFGRKILSLLLTR
jgi:hypothetical protein